MAVLLALMFALAFASHRNKGSVRVERTQAQRPREAPMAKVMIEAAINGVAMKEANPHIGYTPEEIANDAIATCKAGAALIHFHVRKPDGQWCQDVPYYAEVYKRVRSALGANAPLMWPTFPGGKDASVRYSHFAELSKDPATKPDLGAADMWSVNLRMWDAKAKTLRGSTYQNSF